MRPKRLLALIEHRDLAVANEGGKVVLKAGAGDALVSGTIAATHPQGRGGSIDVWGERVGLLAGAQLDASGGGGGGQVRIGGDYQGRNPAVQNALRTYVGPETTVRADATQAGDGGKLVVWSEDASQVYGALSARGGPQGGDGGLVETSSKNHLQVTRAPDVRCRYSAGISRPASV